MMVYPSHDSSFFIPSSLPLYLLQNEFIEVSPHTIRDLQSTDLCQMDHSCNIPNRKYTSSNLERYLPRLPTRNNSRWEGKRSQNINLDCSPGVPNVQLPGISTRRKNSGTDSVISNSNSNTNSTSSWPWEISESESESLISLEDCKLLNKSGPHDLKSSESKTGPSRVPRPPASPRPTRSGKDTCVKAFRKRRNFKRSQHFELTLQNIEEVKDTESDLVKLSGSAGDMEEGKKKNLGVSHSRSYSTPVDYRELRKKIEATRVVSMGDMSPEFTKNYLTQKDKESDDMLRERCINWLQSLSPS